MKELKTVLLILIGIFLHWGIADSLLPAIVAVAILCICLAGLTVAEESI